MSQKAYMLILIFALTLVAICTNTSVAQEPFGRETLKITAQVGGKLEPFITRGNYTYAALGQRMVIIDNTDLYNPVIIGQSALLPGQIDDIDLKMGYAFVANQNGGLRIFDVSNLQTPIEVSRFEMPGWVVGIQIVDDIAFVLNQHVGLRILDISDPTQPQWLGAFTNISSSVTFVIEDHLLYLAGRTGTITILDISLPSAPVLVTTTPTHLDAVLDIQADDHYLYVSGYETSGMLEVYHLTEDFKLERIGFQPLHVSDFEVAFPYIFEALGGSGFRVYDVSDPSEFVEVARWTPKNWRDGAYSMSMQDSIAYIGTSWGGYRVLALTAAIRPLGGFDGFSFVNRIAAENGHVFASAGTFGLIILDVTNPSSPQITSRLPDLGRVIDLATHGYFVYVLVDDDKLYVIDVSEHEKPIIVGAIDVMENAQAVAIAKNELYIGTLNGLYAFDLAVPANPIRIGELEGVRTNGPRQLWIYDDTAMIAQGFDGVSMIDLSDPTHLRIHARIESLRYSASAVAIDDIIYVAEDPLARPESEDIRIIDVTDPMDPHQRGYIDLPGFVELIEATDDQLVATSSGDYHDPEGTGGLRVFDVSDPGSPVERDHFTKTLSIQDIVLHSSRIYLAAGVNGVALLESTALPHTWLPLVLVAQE